MHMHTGADQEACTEAIQWSMGSVRCAELRPRVCLQLLPEVWSMLVPRLAPAVHAILQRRMQAGGKAVDHVSDFQVRGGHRHADRVSSNGTSCVADFAFFQLAACFLK